MELPRRWAGVLAHPTSLPGPGAAGTIGAVAHDFVEKISGLGFCAWQVLPLCPPGPGNSPYSSWSSMMGAPTLIDLSLLADQGLLDHAEAHPGNSGNRVDAPMLASWHEPMLQRAAARLVDRTAHPLHPRFRQWVAEKPWLQEAVRFAARRQAAGGAPWWEWPADLRSRDLEVLSKVDRRLGGTMEVWRALGFLFDVQWASLRARAEACGVCLIGDLPIYVSDDSADCWSRPDLFELDSTGRPTFVAGCPPDYFSELGQRWGNPVYRWEAHAAERYAWWVTRVRRTLEHVHLVRVDHFRGFSAGWFIPADAPDARSGHWVEAPGAALFAVLRGALGSLPLIAEDLGELDEGVYELLGSTGLPGTRVLQFGFDGNPDNPHHPDRVQRNAVAYPGTHDNPTARGWFETLGPEQRRIVTNQLGCDEEHVSTALVGAALDCAARGAVIPLQDLLGLGAQARMNLPGTAEGNWAWRVTDEELSRLSEHDWAHRIRGSDRAR